jgi:hypothetical protein
MKHRDQFLDHPEITDMKTAANYLGVSRSHLPHFLADKIPEVPAIPHIRAGRRALIRRIVTDRWLADQEHRSSWRYVQIAPNQCLRLKKEIV